MSRRNRKRFRPAVAEIEDEDVKFVKKYKVVKLSHHGKSKQESESKEEKVEFFMDGEKHLGPTSKIYKKKEKVLKPLVDNGVWTDFQLLSKDKLFVTPLRRVEPLAYDPKTGSCKIRFDSRVFIVPASYLYKTQERYSPGHIPERINPHSLPKEKLYKISVLHKPQSI